MSFEYSTKRTHARAIQCHLFYKVDNDSAKRRRVQAIDFLK
jgi:hypothetical protein